MNPQPFLAASKRYASKLHTPARGAVVLNVDDGYSSWESVIEPALARYPRARMTFAVWTERIDAVGGVSTATIERLHAKGHEIASHSVTHPNPITSLSVANRVIEYDTSKATLEAIVGAGEIRTFAYPFNTRNQTTDRELYLRYGRVLAGQAPNFWPLGSDGRFVYGRFQWTQTTHAAALDMVRRAAFAPVVVTLYTHDPGNAGGSFPGDPTAEQFAELLALADSLNVPMLRADEALPAAPELLANPRFEAGVSGWGVFNATGGNTVTVETGTPPDGLSGTEHLKIVHGGTGTVTVFQQVPAVGGKEYIWSFWYKADPSGTVKSVVNEYAEDGTQIATTSTGALTNTVWTRNERLRTMAANVSYVEARFFSDAAGTVYITQPWWAPSIAGRI